jgi:hypothetical protein
LIETYHWYQSLVTTTSNKERIEALEARLGGVQDGMQQLELGVADKLHHLEETINKLSEAFLSTREVSSNNQREGSCHSTREGNNSNRQIFSSTMAKLAFPRYSREDPTEWLSRVAQFFEFQGTNDNQKVSLASFHLEGEANQWWQWMRRTYREEGRLVTWEFFKKNCWLVLDQQTVKTLMKHCLEFVRLDPFEITKRSLKD